MLVASREALCANSEYQRLLVSRVNLRDIEDQIRMSLSKTCRELGY